MIYLYSKINSVLDTTETARSKAKKFVKLGQGIEMIVGALSCRPDGVTDISQTLEPSTRETRNCGF